MTISRLKGHRVWITSLLATLMVSGTEAQTPAVPPSPAVIPDATLSRYAIPAAREPRMTEAQELRLLRAKVRYVFVLYQENRSFDSYFGTFPGADGLFSRPPSETPGFFQPLLETDGTQTLIHPFRIGPEQYASDTDDIDHAHSMIVAKMHVAGGKAQMDRFALTEERKFRPTGRPSLKAKQFGELAMAYEDGDTIPFLWRYANRFVLFDRFFQLMAGPSTPGNLSIIGAQTGATQWMLHPEQAVHGNGDSGPGVPVLNDADPFWGSPADKTKTGRQPVNPSDFPKTVIQENLTYATLPLTLTGSSIAHVSRADRAPQSDLGDINDDIADLARSGNAAIPWGWYEEGYDQEPTDPGAGDPVDAEGSHASYITHHNGPQYFGYIANNPKMSAHLHGLHDFFTALAHHSLPSAGGLFYIKGGRRNTLGLKPACPTPKVQANFLGDDDHPGYSDSQISEAQIAETVNRIAAGPYWKQCAIIITWDDSEGDYDHVAPPILSTGPDGVIITDGPRVPLLIISPYARVHHIAHETGNHASVVKFADALFRLKPLADLPDERRGRAIGLKIGLPNQGPFDDLTPDVTDLLPAFDPARLSGTAPPLPAAYAAIPESLVRTLPQKSGYGLRQIGIVPTDYQNGIRNEIPPDFNPRPNTVPTH